MTKIANSKLIYESKPQFSKAARKTFGAGWLDGQLKSHRNPDSGNLTGCTDGDYFYFLCPKCGGVLQFNVLELWEFPSHYPEVKRSPCQHIVFEVWCRHCELGGELKLSNLGRQASSLTDAPA